MVHNPSIASVKMLSVSVKLDSSINLELFIKQMDATYHPHQSLSIESPFLSVFFMLLVAEWQAKASYWLA